MAKLLRVVVVIVMAVGATLASPGYRQPISRDINLTDYINKKLQGILSDVAEPVTLNHPIDVKVDENFVAHVYLKMQDCTLQGLKDIVAHDCTATLQGDISLSIKSPGITLNIGHYFINGSVVDHVQLYGNGPGMISVDDMDVKVEGHAKITLKPSFSLVFDEAVLDLEMRRWTVDLEDLMPDTDLGTLFNEFFSMYGPPIFDILENNINESGKLLEILNNLFSPNSRIF